MIIPQDLRQPFFDRMAAADNNSLPMVEWLSKMEETVEDFAAEHKIDLGPREGLVAYLRMQAGRE